MFRCIVFYFHIYIQFHFNLFISEVRVMVKMTATGIGEPE